SPIAFPMALATTIVPGADWVAAAPFCIVAGVLLMALGWALDTVLKPTPGAGRSASPVAPPEGGWRNLRPLAFLLCAILVPLVVIQQLTGLRSVAVAMIVVPLICLCWIAIQNGGGGAGVRAALRRGVAYFTVELPGYSNELVILTTAGFL